MQRCAIAIRRSARLGTPAFLDSRGLVQLRRGEWVKAVADGSPASLALGVRNAGGTCRWIYDEHPLAMNFAKRPSSLAAEG